MKKSISHFLPIETKKRGFHILSSRSSNKKFCKIVFQYISSTDLFKNQINPVLIKQFFELLMIKCLTGSCTLCPVATGIKSKAPSAIYASSSKWRFFFIFVNHHHKEYPLLDLQINIIWFLTYKQSLQIHWNFESFSWNIFWSKEFSSFSYILG